MSKLFILSQAASERRKKASIDRMKSATTERCNSNTLYHWGKGIIPKIVSNI